MSKVVVDTDVLIDVLRGRPPTRAFLLELTRDAAPCCSTISVAELYAGMRPPEERATMELLETLVILPVTRQIAEVAGRYKRTLGSRRLELADCLIAATAFVEGAPLATGNVRDYPMEDLTLFAARR